MSTAIVRTYTEDGFVVASDGLVRDENNNQITDSAQKIFQHGGLAFSFAGAIKLGTDNSDEVVLHVDNEVMAAAQALAAVGYNTLFDYAQQLSKPIESALRAAQRDGKIKFPAEKRYEGERGCTIAKTHIDGYWNGTPSRATIHFLHDNQEVSNSEVYPEHLSTQPWVLGSTVVGVSFGAGPLFRRYGRRWPVPLHSSQALTQAIEYARMCWFSVKWRAGAPR